MFGLRKILSPLLLVVVFLSLAAFASFYYNAGKEDRDKLTNNEFVIEGSRILGALLGTSRKVADANLQKNIGLGKTMVDVINKIDWRELATGKKSQMGVIDTSMEENGVLDTFGDSFASEMNIDNSASDNSDSAGSVVGFWSNVRAAIKDEWEESRNGEDTAAASGEDPFSARIFDYRKTESGAEIIFTLENGKEYKFTLPFSSLGGV